MKWTWDGGFRAYGRSEDGTIVEKIFTSSAQARQHVEKAEGVVLASKPVISRRLMSKNKVMRRANSTPITKLSDQQTALKAEAMKMAQGL